MFLMDLAFAAELIALALGVGLLVWAYRSEGAGVALARVFGYIITIAAILTALCTSFYGISYWMAGYYQSPIAPMMMKGQMMQQCPMMKQRMMQQQKNPGSENQHQHSGN